MKHHEKTGLPAIGKVIDAIERDQTQVDFYEKTTKELVTLVRKVEQPKPEK